MNVQGYELLADVLQRAYNDAAIGKGAARHAVDRPFHEQPMQSISDLLGTPAGLLYQAMKKIQESQRLDHDAAIKELLGAINYIAGTVINMEGKRPRTTEQLAAMTKASTAPDVEEIFRPVGLVAMAKGYWACDCSTPPAGHIPIGDACPRCFKC